MAAPLRSKIDCGRDQGTEKNVLVVSQSCTLIITQWSWVNVFKSLESFLVSPATREVALEESGVWRRL